MIAQQLDIESAIADLDSVSEPITGETKATVDLVANDWRSDDDWKRFEDACRSVAEPDERLGYVALLVDPNRVRSHLTNGHGLSIEPRRYSAFWSRAAGKHGFLVSDGWVTNTDHAGGNAGKPLRRYRLRT